MITVAEIRTALLASPLRGKQRVQEVADKLYCEVDEVRRVARTLSLTMYSAKKILIEDAIRASPGRRLSHIANQFEVSRQRVHQIATRLRKTKTKTKTSEAL